MKDSHILLVDDDPDVLQVTNVLLAKAEYQVSTAQSAEDCLKMLTQKQSEIDLILLDIMMPGMNGLELLSRLRAEADTKELPILLHSSMGEEDVIVKGLELGADDFITKNVSSRIKLSRIQAALRRSTRKDGSQQESSHSESTDLVKLIASEKCVLIDGQKIALRDLELGIFELFLKYPGSLLSLTDFTSHVRRTRPQTTKKEIETTMAQMLRRLGASGRRIEKVLGVGFRLRTDSAA